MYLTDLNLAGGIGANSTLVEIGPFRILVDAGLHPKKLGHEALPRFDRIRETALDLIILTHCHLDHLGSLPVVARQHPQAEIWMSRESSVLAPRMMRNSVRVMSRQREEADISEYPLYTDAEVRALEERFVSLPLDRPNELHLHGEVLTVEFFHAGHVPGAVSVRLRHGKESLLFSGDILFTDQHILPGARPGDHSEVNTLVLEQLAGFHWRDGKRFVQPRFPRESVGKGYSLRLPGEALAIFSHTPGATAGL